MIAEIKLIKKTALEELIESNNTKAITEMIEVKEISLKNALENAEFYRSINNLEFADNEQSRANRLQRDISKLRAAIL